MFSLFAPSKSVKVPVLIDLGLSSCEGITSASMGAIYFSRILEVSLQPPLVNVVCAVFLGN